MIFDQEKKWVTEVLSYLHTLYILVITNMAINYYFLQCKYMTTKNTACIHNTGSKHPVLHFLNEHEGLGLVNRQALSGTQPFTPTLLASVSDKKVIYKFAVF